MRRDEHHPRRFGTVDVGMSKVLIVSGAGDYSDPWHPFPDTS